MIRRIYSNFILCHWKVNNGNCHFFSHNINHCVGFCVDKIVINELEKWNKHRTHYCVTHFHRAQKWAPDQVEHWVQYAEEETGNSAISSLCFCYSILLIIVANGKYRAYGRTIPVTDSGLRFGVQMIFVSFFCCNWNDLYQKSFNSKVIIGSIWHTLRFDLMKHVFKAKPLFRRHLECVEAIYSISMLLHEFGWTVTSMMCCPFWMLRQIGGGLHAINKCGIFQREKGRPCWQKCHKKLIKKVYEKCDANRMWLIG